MLRHVMLRYTTASIMYHKENGSGHDVFFLMFYL